MVTAVLPVAIVPLTDALTTGIDVDPDAAPAAVTVNDCPATMTVELPGTATLSALTGIELMLPLRAAAVAARFGSSGGRSSLLTKPLLSVNPAEKSYTPLARKKHLEDPVRFGFAAYVPGSSTLPVVEFQDRDAALMPGMA